MNRYELAHHHVVQALDEQQPGLAGPHNHRLADAVVGRLVAEGIIQSTIPGDLIPGGMTD